MIGAASQSKAETFALPRGAAALRRAKTFARVSAVDGASIFLLVGEWAGLALGYTLHHHGLLPGPLAAFIGLAAMNLAFSVWHEGVHQTLARQHGLNHLLAAR